MKYGEFYDGAGFYLNCSKKENNCIINVLQFIDQYKIGGPGKTILNSNLFADINRLSIHVASFFFLVEVVWPS